MYYSFNEIFDSVFGTADDDFKALRRGYGGAHPFSCQCLSCTFVKLTAAPTTDFLLTQEMPGVKKENVSVTLKANLLNIKWTSRLGESKNFSTTISKHFDLDKLDCSYDNGLLTIKVPLKKQLPQEPPEIPETKIEIK